MASDIETSDDSGSSPRGSDRGLSVGLRAFGKTVVAGVAVAIPFLISIWVLWWIGTKIEDLARWALRTSGAGSLPEDGWKWSAIAIAIGVPAGLLLFWLAGMLTRMYIGRKLVALGEFLVLHIPLIKSLYEASRDMMRFFGGEKTAGSKVVYVSLAGGQIQMIGLLTNEQPRGCPKDPSEAVGRVAVWLPMSYQLGGFMIYVRPDQVRPAHLSVEQAMKICATADMG